MIVATHMGMYMPALRPDWERCIAAGEPELQVRSRRAIDLDNLRDYSAVYGIDLGPTIRLKGTDYQFRAYCTRAEWGEMLGHLSVDIDYIKFKDTPKKYHGDTKLTDCYSKMWNAIFSAFPTGSIYSTPRIQQPTTYRQPRRESFLDAQIHEPRQPSRPGTWTRMSDMTPNQLAALHASIDMSDEMGPPVVNGHLDHSNCTHVSSKSARRACRRRWVG